MKKGIEVVEAENYKKLSEISAEAMLECLKEKPDALFCIASGGSPTLAYKLFVEKAHKENVDVTKLRIIKLDDWFGVNGEDPCTSEAYVRKNFLEPLNIPAENYIGFNSGAEDGEKECQRINEFLKEYGPIDLCILGLGKNGHLGLNEPGGYLEPFSHIVKLDKKTKTHDMLKATKTSINYGITIGLSQIMASEKILFIVAGDEKTEAFNGFLEKKVRCSLPASILWLHPNTLCVFESRCK